MHKKTVENHRHLSALGVNDSFQIVNFAITVVTMNEHTRGVQYVMKTAQYIPKVYIHTLHNYFH